MQIFFLAIILVVVLASASFLTKKALQGASQRMGRNNMVVSLETLSQDMAALETNRNMLTSLDYSLQKMQLERTREELISWL